MKYTTLILIFLFNVKLISAIDFIIDDINYTTSGTNTVSVENNDYTGAITIPSSVDYEGTTYTVTAIARNAFNQCTEVSDISLPSTIYIINRESFSGCTGLTTITIPSSVTNIERDAFSDCIGLTTVNFQPDSCTVATPFRGCSALSEVNFAIAVTQIPETFFFGSGIQNFTIPSNIISIVDKPIKVITSLRCKLTTSADCN